MCLHTLKGIRIKGKAKGRWEDVIESREQLRRWVFRWLAGTKFKSVFFYLNCFLLRIYFDHCKLVCLPESAHRLQANSVTFMHIEITSMPCRMQVLTQEVWSTAWDAPFLTNSKGGWGYTVHRHTLNSPKSWSSCCGMWLPIFSSQFYSQPLPTWGLSLLQK